MTINFFSGKGKALVFNSSFVEKFSPLLRVSKLVFTPLAISFIFYFIWQSFDELYQLFSEASKLHFLACIILWILLQFFSPLFTLTYFKNWNIECSYIGLMLIHARRLPAKYLPGAIWHSVARLVDYHELKLNKSKLATYFFLENFILATSTVSLGALLLTLFQPLESPYFLPLVIISILGLLLLILCPFILKHTQKIGVSEINFAQYYKSVVIVSIFWLIAGFGFTLFLQAFEALNINNTYLHLAGVYLFSWGAGFLTFFAPQGIGVSEYISTQLLDTNNQLGYFVSLLASFRILILIGDLMTWLLAQAYITVSNNRKNKVERILD